MIDNSFIVKLSPPLAFITETPLPNIDPTTPALVNSLVLCEGSMSIPVTEVSPISIFYASDQFRIPGLKQPAYGILMAWGICSRISRSSQRNGRAKLIGIRVRCSHINRTTGRKALDMHRWEVQNYYRHFPLVINPTPRRGPFWENPKVMELDLTKILLSALFISWRFFVVTVVVAIVTWEDKSTLSL